MSRSHPDQLLNLYKYRSLAPPYGRETAENIIRHNRMFWQSPLAFNDPFDCDPVGFFGKSKASRVEYAKRVVAGHYSHLSRGERSQKPKEFLAVPAAARAQQMRSAFRDWMSESAVTCFSQINDSILMWGHYADSHRGVCFIFREVMHPYPWIAFDVTYSEERPDIDYTDDPETLIRQGVLNKSHQWTYEQECRMFEYRRANGLRSFPAEALVGVIYGARISDEDRAFMDALLNTRPWLERFQATLDEQYFRVNINRA
jgi:hypothetical protein